MAVVETLMLANHVEALSGLLYIHGGGWSHHWRPDAPPGQLPPSQVGIAVTFLIPAAEAGLTHSFVLRLVTDPDGEEVMRLEGTFGVAVDPGNPDAAQRTALGANVTVGFPRPGRYLARAEVPGVSEREVEFWVHDGPPGSQPGTQPAGPTEEGGTVPGYM